MPEEALSMRKFREGLWLSAADLCHTGTGAVLNQAEAVARRVVALSTYLGHTDIAHTYWYLEATPELLTGI